MKPSKKIQEEKQKREYVGKVVSTHMQNTLIVSIDRIWHHRLYKKAVKRARRFAVHNDKLELAVGDLVRIIETKPISKRKHFMAIGKVARERHT